MPATKYRTPRRRAFVIGISAIGAILVLLTLLPGIIYFVALYNIDGRPTLAQKCQLNAAQKLVLWRDQGELAESENDVVTRAMNPWGFAARFHFGSLSKRNPGERAAWFVARNHNFTHLGNRRMAWWHVSGAALTIWLTRHWTAEELLCKINEIEAQQARN